MSESLNLIEGRNLSSPRDYKSRIEPRLPDTGKSRIKTALFISLGVLITGAVASQFFGGPETREIQPAADSSSPIANPQRVTLSLPLPALKKDGDESPAVYSEPKSAIVPQKVIPVEKKQANGSLKQLQHTVKSGENLSIIFSKLDLSKNELHEIVHSGSISKELKSLRAGKKLSIYVTEQNKVKRLVYEKNRIDSIVATRTEQGFNVTRKSKEIDRHQTFASARIQSSLFNDAKKAGVSDKTIMELANVFGWDIDFALDLRENDQFSILYEKQFVDGKEINAGNILAAEFTNRGKTFRAVRYIDSEGHSNYFTPEGDSMRKTFLRTPVDFARISSRFNLKRKHPVLNRIRAHKGVDYAASTGTPIKTTGDGKIIFRGRKGGYGRVVIVQHGQRYTTLYAHLSKFHGKRRNGSHVKQGQVIGYVGKSGLATGAHLHYEFRVNGVHRNPLTVSLPQAESIPKQYLAEFNRQTQPLISQLDQVKTVRLAQVSGLASP